MQENLHILVVTNTYPTAEKPGDSPQIHDQVEAIKARGVQVDLLYINRYKNKLSYFQAAWKILKLSFQNNHFQIIHAFYGHCGLIANLQWRYPVITTFLGSDLLHPRDGRIGKIAAKFSDAVIVQSEEMKKKVNRHDVSIIPFGVNLTLFTKGNKEEARRELGLGLEEKLVLFPWDPSRIVKRFDIIQSAVQIIQQKYENVRIFIVYDQPHEVIAKYMHACDVMILASNHEGSPMALREAMACGLPIVSVDVGDVRQFIQNTKGCFICKRDPIDIADKVCKVFEWGNRTNGAEIIRKANITWGADQVISLYLHVLNSQKKLSEKG